jgi:DNA-binding CsgD family transcriptional regulator
MEIERHTASKGGLTRRQTQALVFAAHGFTPRETAVALDLSPRTIHDYLRTGRLAIGATSRAEVVQWAINQGLFPSRPVFLEAALSRSSQPARVA